MPKLGLYPIKRADEESPGVEGLYRLVDEGYDKRYRSNVSYENIKEELSDWLANKLSSK